MNKFDEITGAYSEQIWVLLGIVAVLCIFFVWLGSYIRRQDPLARPSKLMLVVEMYYDFIKGTVNSIFYGHAGIMFPYVAMLLLFVATMNYIGLVIPFHPPTTDYNVTLGLALISFGFRYGYDFKYNGIVHHLKSYFKPYPFMFPIHVLDIVAKPLSMSMRLFGNILSGVMILTVLYAALGALQGMVLGFLPTDADGGALLNIFGAVVAPPLHFYLDVFAGSIQAFVFTLLTLIFTAIELDMDKLDKIKKAKEEKQKDKLAISKEGI